VRGKVSRRITTAEYRAAINWSVQVNWYGPDRNGDGAPDRILRTVVKTNGDGAYAMQYRDVRDPVYVEVMAVRCDFDQNSNAYDCCIATDACQSSCPDVWAATHGTTVKKNETARIDLIVNCAVD